MATNESVIIEIEANTGKYEQDVKRIESLSKTAFNNMSKSQIAIAKQLARAKLSIEEKGIKANIRAWEKAEKQITALKKRYLKSNINTNNEVAQARATAKAVGKATAQELRIQKKLARQQDARDATAYELRKVKVLEARKAQTARRFYARYNKQRQADYAALMERQRRLHLTSLQRQLEDTKKYLATETAAYIKAAKRRQLARKVKAANSGAGHGFGGRDMLDSIKIVAKYGAISQALFGIQNLVRSTGAEMLRFDQSIRDNMAVLQLNNVEARKLADTVTQLGINYGLAFDDIQQGTITLGRAGVDSPKQLAQGMEGLAALSIITGDAIKYGAEAMASMLAVYPKLADNMGSLSDKMGAVANATRLGLEDFSTIANYALTTAKNVGITSDSYLVLAGSMSKIGVSASSIGTSIARVGKFTLDQSKSVANFFETLGISQATFRKKLARGAKEDASVADIRASEQALRDFAKVTGEASKDTDLWAKATAGLQIQMKKTANQFGLMGKNDVMTKMTDEVNNAKSVVNQAGIAAESLGKKFQSMINIIYQEAQQKLPNVRNQLLGILPSAESFRSFVGPVVKMISGLIGILDNLLVAFVAFKSVRFIAIAIDMLTLSLNKLTVAAGASVARLRILSKVTKLFSRQNLVIAALVAAYSLWNNAQTKAAENQEKLKNAVRTTNEELSKMTQAQRNAVETKLWEAERDAVGKVTAAVEALRVAKREGESQTGLQATIDGAKQELDIIREKQESLETINKHIKANEGATRDGDAATKNLAASVEEVAAKTAQATARALELAAAFRTAVSAFYSALINFKVISGQMTTSVANSAKYAEQTAATQADITAEVAKQASLKAAQATGELSALDMSKNKKKVEESTTKLLTLQTRQITEATQFTTAKNAIDQKAISDRVDGEKAVLALAESNKSVNIKTYQIEKRRAEARSLGVDIKGARESLALAIKSGSIDEQTIAANKLKNLEARKGVAIQQESLAIQRKAKSDAAGKKKKKTGASDRAARNRLEADHNRLITDAINLSNKQAELENAKIDLLTAQNGLLLTRAEKAGLEIRDAKLKVGYAREAFILAQKEAKKLKGKGGGDKAKKKVLTANIKLVKAETNLAKKMNKEAVQVASKLKSMSDGIVDNLMSGDVKGAFKSMADGFLDIFISPIKDAFSTLFGNTVSKLVSGMMEDMLVSMGIMTAKSVVQSQVVGTAAAPTAVVKGAEMGGWVGMAAMAAAVAALGFAVSGGGGDGGAAKMAAAKKQAEQDGKVQSKSVENLLKSIDDIGVRGLGYSAKMAASLKVLENQTQAAAKHLPMGIGGEDYVSTKKKGFWNDSETSLLASGIKLDKATIAQINDGQMSAAYYQTVATENSGWLGIGSGVDIDTRNTGSASADVLEPIANAYKASLGAVQAASEALGVSSEEFVATSAAWETSAHTLNLMGKDAEEQAQLIQGAISADADNWVASIESIQPIIAQYAKVGEGAGETLMRMVYSYEQVDVAMRDMGKTLPALAEGGMDVADAMIKAVGGIDKFVKGIEEWNDAFMSDNQKQAKLQRDLTISAKAVGLALPRTKQGFLDLRNSLLILAPTSAVARQQIEWLDMNLSDLSDYANYAAESVGRAGRSLASAGKAGSTCSSALGGCSGALDSCGGAAGGAVEEIEDFATAVDALAAKTSFHARKLALEGSDEDQAKYAVTSAKAMLKALKIETKLGHLNIDNYERELALAFKRGNMTTDMLADFESIGSAILDIAEAEKALRDLRLDAQLEKVNAEVAFYEDLFNKLRTAFSGPLSPYNTREKAAQQQEFSNAYHDAGTTNEQGYFDSLYKGLEYEKKMSVTKEAYAILFDEYLNDLKNIEYVEEEKTTNDVVKELEEANKKLDDLTDAIEKASYK